MSAPGDKAEDIVQRLHKIAGQYDECDWHGAIELEAADEITRLRAEVARLIKGIEDALRGTTHWDGCEERHWECALLKSVGK